MSYILIIIISLGSKGGVHTNAITFNSESACENAAIISLEQKYKRGGALIVDAAYCVEKGLGQ